jgi:hypothetical protein
MKTKSLAMFGLMVVFAAQVGQAANISVGYQNYNTVYNLVTDAALAPSSQVWFGSWNNGTNPTGILNEYFAGTISYTDVSAAFLIGATKTYQDFGDGSEPYVFSMSDVGFVGRNVDMILWNASTAQTATQAAAFRWSSAAYPDGTSLDTEIQVANVLPSLDPDVAVSVLYGTAQDSGSDGIGYIFTAGAAAVPEPSTASMLIAGIALVLRNVRKSRNS